MSLFRRAIEALESEERFRVVVEKSPVGICVHCEGKIVFANATAATILGAKAPEELIGLSPMDHAHPDE